ncbi:transposase [Streptosporangium sp. NPDC003464]
MDDRLKRHDLTEDEWIRLVPLLPAHPRRGHRWADHRAVINGVFFRTRTACSWRGLPEVYGRWKTVYNRHRRWSQDGTWETILDALRAGDALRASDALRAGDAPRAGDALRACHDGAGGRDRPGGPGSTAGGTRPRATGARHAPPEDIRPGKIFELPGW